MFSQSDFNMFDSVIVPSPHFAFGLDTSLKPSTHLATSTQSPPHVQTIKGIDPQTHQRALTKIASLDRTIDQLHQSHAKTLQDLHKEIAKLQDTCAELTLKKVHRQSIHDTTDIKKGLKKLEIAASNPRQECSESVPLYLSIQNQKEKYRSLIDRLSNENKRKSYMIDSLRNQLELIKKALGLAGLELDMKELQSLVHNKTIEKKDQVPPPETAKEPLESVSEAAEEVIVPERVPVDVINIPMHAFPPEGYLEEQSISSHLRSSQLPHEPKEERPKAPEKESLASIGKSYIHHILATRNLNRDTNARFEVALKNKDWTEARDIPNDKGHIFLPRAFHPHSEVYGKLPMQTSATSLYTNTTDQTAATGGNASAVQEGSSAEHVSLNPKTLLPPIPLNDLPAGSVSEETQSVISKRSDHFLRHHGLQVRHVDLTEDFEDAGSVNHWRTDHDHSIPENQALLNLESLNQKPSKYTLKVTRSKKLKERQAKKF